MATLDGGELLELFCPICYGDQGDDGHATLVCGHVFHASCLERSLKNKKECPSCRCPARPLDTARRDAPKQPKCPCKTGQPIRLYHLQRPRIAAGDNAAPIEPGGPTSGAAPYTSEALAAALLASSEQRAAQRESRLREALEEERQRAGWLEQQLAEQKEELDKATAKAARRKNLNNRLLEDKTRLEAREREQGDELSRLRQALHNARMDMEKSRAALYERDEAVLRLKRELGVQRARGGGAAAPHPRELAELLGEHKEDWQQVYSIKVEELRRANETAAELRIALGRSAIDAETRVAAERLAGAERVKAVAQERDEAKRELMELEYKLHEAERRLRERPPPPSRPPLVPQGPAGDPTNAARAPVRSATAIAAATGNSAAPKPSSLSALSNRHRALASGLVGTVLGAGDGGGGSSGGGGLRRGGADLVCGGTGSRSHHQAGGGMGTGGKGGGDAVLEDGEDELEALALITMSCCPIDDDDNNPDDEVVDDVLGDVEMMEGGRRLGNEAVASRKRQLATDSCIGLNNDENADNDQDIGGSHDRNRNGGELLDEDLRLPPSTRRRQGPPLHGVTAVAAAGDIAGCHAGAGSTGLANDGYAGYGNDPRDVIEDEPVPVLPRAFSGLFSGGRGGGRGGGGGESAAPGRVEGRGGAFVGSFFAGKTGSGTTGHYRSGSGGGGSGGSSLIGEGPDGRGGTNRFPLVSSFTHNAVKGPTTKLLGPTSRGGRGAGHNRPQVGSLPAAGRIDAFLRPVQPQVKKR